MSDSTDLVRTATTGLSENEKAKALQSYKELQIKEAEKENVVGEYIDETKNSLIFQYNWEELLGASPMAVNLIGACYIAASSPVGITVTLDPPANGFKFLSHISLRANLVQCGNIGSQAFLYAKPQMSHIQMVSTRVFKTVNQIIGCLEDGQQAKKQLKLNMKMLKRSADDCAATALAMDEKFSDWLNYVCELHEVTIENESTTKAKQHANEVQLMAKQCQYEMTEEARSAAAEAVDTLKDTLRTSQQAYQQASDNYPSGWDLIGQQFVGGLCDTINGAFNTFIPAIANNINPVAKAKAGFDMFKNILHPGKGGSGTSTAATGTAAPEPQVQPPDYSDPAYTIVTMVKDPVSTLLAILNEGPDNGIDWESVKQRGDPKTGLRYCNEMLGFSKRNFKSSGKEPSVMLEKAIEECIRTATQVEKCANGTSMNWQPPAPDSPQVREWQKSVEDASIAVTMLDAVASSTSRTRPPLVNPGNQSISGSEKGALASAILNRAAERLRTSQNIYEASQENYLKATDKYADVTRSMAEIAGELSKLKGDNITMTEIKVILTKCIEALVTLKAQIRKLVNFFKALAEITSFVEKYHVQPFLDSIDIIADEEPSISGFTYTDMQRQVLFNATIMIRAYFGLFRDIAGMYILSTKDLDEGFNLLDQLAQDTEGRNQDVIEEKQARLQRWTNTATASIQDLVAQKQREIKDNMEARVRGIAEDSRLLPPPPPAQIEAIEQGKKVVTDAATKGLEAYNPPAARPLSRSRRLLAPEE
ncbi:hypothetical protein DFP73DRAFT_501746 [Morchella snyderi]|nr:hypothetical protein DFP73DRAFT_501746 [Morchella snyderi]